MITFSRNPKVIGDNDIPELSLRSEEKVKVIEDKLNGQGRSNKEKRKIQCENWHRTISTLYIFI